MKRLIRLLSLLTILLFVGGMQSGIAQSPGKEKKKNDDLKPIVVHALKMVESPPLSSLPAAEVVINGAIDSRRATSEEAGVVNELNTDVERTPASKTGSVDGALRAGPSNLNMPAPLFTFEGLADVDNLGLVNPPDTN